MKILYALSKRIGAEVHLKRFLTSINEKHIIKISAYKNTISNINIDWSLDALDDIFDKDHMHLSDNSNLEIYHDQIKYFSPNIIISDLEKYTSYIAKICNIPIIQISPLLLQKALSHSDKYASGINNKYSNLFINNKIENLYISNYIDNSDFNFVYSNLCDVENSPQLKEKFEYIRPYHLIGKKSNPCKHNIVSIFNNNDKRIFHILKKYDDCIVFTNNIYEKYNNISLKNINNISEYICNLYNSNIIVNNGQTDYIADAFYNNKFCFIKPDFTNPESVMNALMMKHFNLGKMLVDDEDLLIEEKEVKPIYNNKIKFLHERIEDL